MKENQEGYQEKRKRSVSPRDHGGTCIRHLCGTCLLASTDKEPILLWARVILALE